MTGTNLRSVFDSSVVISAMLLPGSVPRLALDRAFLIGTVLISTAWEAELARVLRRPKFDAYLSEADRLRFFAALIRRTELVEVTDQFTACRDPNDNHGLELAVSGSADCIVTGDRDLTSLDPFRGIPILSPQSFLDQF